VFSTFFFEVVRLTNHQFNYKNMRFYFIDPTDIPEGTSGVCLSPIIHGFMTLSHGFVHDCMKKLRYCPSRSLVDSPWGALPVGFKAGADCIVFEKDGRWYAKSERGTNTYPLFHEAQVETEFQPVLSCWRGSRKGCVDCSRACPDIDPAVKRRRELQMSPAVVASKRAKKRVERFLLSYEPHLAISSECLSEKVSNLMKVLGAKGGRVKSEKKRLAAKANALKRWSANR